MTKLKTVPFREVLPYQARATRDHISVRDAKDAVWFHYVNAAGEVLGICSLLPLGKESSRLKAIWIKPEHRGKGHGKAMVEHLMAFARKAGASERLEVIAYNPAFYEARGFKKVGNPRPNGAQRLVKVPV